MPANFIGIFEGGYDPAAALVADGRLLAFAEEERFLRNKHATGWYPSRSLRFCLDQAGIGAGDVQALALNWDVPSYTNGVMKSFFDGMRAEHPVDAATIGWQESLLRHYGEDAVVARHAAAWKRTLGADRLPPIYPVPHHYTHALHAFMQSPYEDALCLTVDGSGDQYCTVLWHCQGDSVVPIYEIAMPHSLGWFYAAATEFLGFEAYDGEYKVMGLAAYGKPNRQIQDAVGKILFAAEDGIGYRLDPRMIHYGPHSWSKRFTDLLPALLGHAPRAEVEPLERWHFDFAYAVQDALEQAALRLVRWGQERTGTKNLCIGGGVGLNVKMNTRLFEVKGISHIFPHPLCSDSGAAAGAAFVACWHQTGVKPEKLASLAVGNAEDEQEIEQTLRRCGIAYSRSNDIAVSVARELSEGRIVGWFQGRMEAGPRALGQRSILADPRSESARDRVNAVIKYREPWRPFCPSMKAEAADRYLVNWDDAPFMVIAFDAKPELKRDAPAIVHVDDTVRVQLVHQETHPLYHRLIDEFEKLTGVPVLLNTSFNVKGEPIVCTPTDAIRTFFGTGMDTLAVGDFLVRKPAVPVAA
ncbi:carbamoyltransferase C-terminal domain-containing protein [Sphingosinicella sp. BN140058]|uniref:carbamoyltransferase family protein n=1 Tax=Sphingosinicella sp. BN140058 TaxID=1892855 RepID=UPI0010118959|nr:carbamoyltransferase C-terminal domain-containing protein [Sphingosinicella sp. BN140058]QAY78089.1 nodulation protein [Sphingosinicella sp. BN140058]